MSRSGSADVKRGHGGSGRGHNAAAPGARGADRTSTRRAARGLARHLDGWQPGLVAVFLAGSAAMLAVPRPVEPAELPVPLSDARALGRVAAADAALAERAEQLGLDADVRELGSAFRAFGIADEKPERTEAEVVTARRRVLAAVGPALAQGEDAVLRLRAYELRSFLREVRRWETTGEVSDELRELGGDFIGLLRRSGWVGDRATPGPRGARTLAMDDTVLAALFKKRWSAIVDTRRGAFDLTLDEQRALFAFLLSHPIGARTADRIELGPSAATAPSPDAPKPVAAAMLLAEQRRAAEQYRLKKIEELAALDPAYPKELARGVVLYRLGRYLPAVEAFRRHLDASPDGPYALRARNYLRAALGRASDEDL